MADHPNFDPAKSRAYDPNYRPRVPLWKLVHDNPGNQFLADRLAELQAAWKERAAESE